MKILIIEDEVKIAKSLKKGFEEEMFTVDSAFDGEQGYEMAKKENYDAIVLDLMLPKMDGIEILEMLRENNIFTPVIILTAKDSVADKINGLDIGADDYLAKPFSFEELLARIRSLIRRATTHEKILTINNLELNPYTHIVTRNQNQISLSAKEFAMLEYLMRRKGAILSEKQIFSHVWDYDADVDSNVVAAHIKNLRQKVDKPYGGKNKLIKTVRGLGYKIE